MPLDVSRKHLAKSRRPLSGSGFPRSGTYRCMPFEPLVTGYATQC